jgi:hypothetical protein
MRMPGRMRHLYTRLRVRLGDDDADKTHRQRSPFADVDFAARSTCRQHLIASRCTSASNRSRCGCGRSGRYCIVPKTYRGRRQLVLSPEICSPHRQSDPGSLFWHTNDQHTIFRRLTGRRGEPRPAELPAGPRKTCSWSSAKSITSRAAGGPESVPRAAPGRRSRRGSHPRGPCGRACPWRSGRPSTRWPRAPARSPDRPSPGASPP